MTKMYPQQLLLKNVMIFQQAPKNANMLGYFYKKVCQQILSTIAQTGHAANSDAKQVILLLLKKVPAQKSFQIFLVQIFSTL